MKNFYFFIGTTAELIKLAPVIRELELRKIPFKIISSNQNKLHFEELKGYFKIQKADYVLKIKKTRYFKNMYIKFILWFVKTSLNYILYFRNVIPKEERSRTYFIVHGDTISTLLGAVVAKISNVSLVHIESGLRSFNLLEPFPEEISRRIVSQLVDMHFCPNKWSYNNLESTSGEKIITNENTVSEITLETLKTRGGHGITKLRNKKYFVLVIHRQEHTLFNNHNMKQIIRTLTSYATEDINCVFIMHKITKNYLHRQGLYKQIYKNKNILMPDRMPYKKFIKLLAASEFVVTDGGTNQEECYVLGKPCLLLRKHSERIEGLNQNAVLSLNNITTIKEFLDNYKKYQHKKLVLERKTPSTIIVDNLLG